MNEQISALMDGELVEGRARVTAEVATARVGRDCWAEYQLIGDALRHVGPLELDITARVMQVIARDPVVLAPQRVVPKVSLTPIAMAAAVAAVALVGGLLLGRQETGNARLAASAEVVQVPVELAAANLQAYLVAHQAHAPVQTVHGAAHYLKTVAVDAEGAR